MAPHAESGNLDRFGNMMSDRVDQEVAGLRREVTVLFNARKEFPAGRRPT
ncbi:hypothetical protein ACWDVU_35050 [Streptomyces sp. NPDC003333]